MPRFDPNTCLVFKSTDGGDSWVLLHQFDPLDSFVPHETADSYRYVDAIPGDTQTVVTLGNADGSENVRPQTWISTDQAVTWQLNPNFAAPVDSGGNFMQNSAGIYAIPGRSVVVIVHGQHTYGTAVG